MNDFSSWPPSGECHSDPPCDGTVRRFWAPSTLLSLAHWSPGSSLRRVAGDQARYTARLNARFYARCPYMATTQRDTSALRLTTSSATPPRLALVASNKSGNIEAIEFLLTLGGTWVTDCGCRTVTDLEQADVPDYFYEHAAGRYAVTAEDDLVTHVGPGAFDAITEALDHTCEASP